MRFIHHIDALADFSSLKFTKYNQYESLVLPLMNYLKEQGVHFQYDTVVKNVMMSKGGLEKVAKELHLTVKGEEQVVQLSEDDLVFVTNGSITDSSTYGTQDEPAPPTYKTSGGWDLWKNLAAQDADFGYPEKFYKNIPKASWFVSATVTTLDDKVAPYIERISKRDPMQVKL